MSQCIHVKIKVIKHSFWSIIGSITVNIKGFDRPLSCDKEDGKHEGPKGSIGLLFKRGKRKVTARRKKGKIQLAEKEKNITEF